MLIGTASYSWEKAVVNEITETQSYAEIIAIIKTVEQLLWCWRRKLLSALIHVLETRPKANMMLDLQAN